MYSSTPRPKWWQLYLSLPLLIALLLVERQLRLSPRGHIAAQLGILLLVYGGIHWWLKLNAPALSRMDQRQYHGTIRVVRLPLVELPENCDDKQPRFQLPALEVKGVLSDTFDMDYIDAEALPVDDASQEFKE